MLTRAPSPLTVADCAEITAALRDTADFWAQKTIGSVSDPWTEEDVASAALWIPRYRELADRIEALCGEAA